MTSIGVLTTSRSEYYQLRPLLTALQQSVTLSLKLFVSGSHLSAQFGRTELEILADGFVPCERIPILVDEDSALGTSLTSGLAVQMIASALVRQRPDLLLLAGDRYETAAAALAATCLGVPIAHLHGGETTEGTVDEAWRHAISKLSALHFVSTDVYRERLIQMGEQPDRVVTTGALFVDQIRITTLLSEAELAGRLQRSIVHPVALVAYHPAGRDSADAVQTVTAILDAVAARCRTVIVTGPGPDVGHDDVRKALAVFVETQQNAGLYANLGSQLFLSVMACADVLIGNSSSGIHEAASFQLPAVNVGRRQAGRLRPRNVVDAEPDVEAVRKALGAALSPSFRQGLAGAQNPFGDGHAAGRMVAHLEAHAPFTAEWSQKRFADGPRVAQAFEAWRSANGDR